MLLDNLNETINISQEQGVNISLIGEEWISDSNTTITIRKRPCDFTLHLRIISRLTDNTVSYPIAIICDNTSNNQRARVEISRKYRSIIRYKHVIRDISIAPGIRIAVRENKSNKKIFVVDNDEWKIKTSGGYRYHIKFEIRGNGTSDLEAKK